MTAETAALSASMKVETATSEERLAALFDAHHERLYRLARRLSSNVDDARDLVQETYLRAAQKLSSVPLGADREEAWLVRVLTNICRDRWRRQGVRKRFQHAEHEAITTVQNADAALIAKDTVWRALQSVAPRRRAILVMCELEGQTTTSVARVLGLSAVSVRWHLSRGRKELLRLIGRQWER